MGSLCCCVKVRTTTTSRARPSTQLASSGAAENSPWLVERKGVFASVCVGMFGKSVVGMFGKSVCVCVCVCVCGERNVFAYVCVYPYVCVYVFFYVCVGWE